ncbi:MAG TPA: hypothetical protein VGQ59_07850 [Cyclobacteriaceae bacterium]|jgi:hypothetical protein|nr:hypothetical protein [Cyclobacteriaceae bacterium]
MKTVKSALLGSKQIADTSADVMVAELKGIIKEHRSIIITRLISDLGTYLSYKFEARIDGDILFKAKDKLLEIRDGSVDLNSYDNVLQQLLKRAVVHLTNEPFYKEIDEAMNSIIKNKKLETV